MSEPDEDAPGGGDAAASGAGGAGGAAAGGAAGEDREGRKRRRRRRGRGGESRPDEARGEQAGSVEARAEAQRQPRQQEPQRQREPQRQPDPQRDRQRQPDRERLPEQQRDRQRQPDRERQPEQQRDRQRQPDRERLPEREAEAHERDSEPTVEAWGRDDDGPPKEIQLASDLPAEPPADDPDPVTFELAGASLGEDVASVVGVQVVPAGRIQWCDAGDGDYQKGERVVVDGRDSLPAGSAAAGRRGGNDGERGSRVATVVVPPVRRPVRDRSLRRVLRRANPSDLRGNEPVDRELRLAKDRAAALRLPLKVFRVEKAGGKLVVYYTSDERLDVRDFVRELGSETGARIELRQLGARDEAKVVGGIGSCGLTLCCTTWLPEFVPVSIKMAKDQGLVLSPTKVAGQCGRLKCCLVYEQAAYAELRKGLPKLGKRVVTARGDGRVVEVDVLRQRVRVSYAPGDSEVLPASDVKPMFPPGNRPGHEPEHEADHEPDHEPEPAPEPAPETDPEPDA